MQALKALIQEKSLKINPENGEIPSVCNCGT